MIKKRNFIIIAGFLAIMISIGGVYLYNKQKDSIVYSKESSYKLVDSKASFLFTYSNLNEMYTDSDIIAKVRVTSQENRQEGSFTSTISNVQVLNTFKGNSLSNLKIYEVGGLVDTSKINDSAGKIKDQGIVEITVEGSQTLKNGKTYFVFLKKNPLADYFAILGSIQGKLKLDDKTNKVTSTIKPEKMKQNPKLFFLQNEFDGKSIVETETTIKNLKK